MLFLYILQGGQAERYASSESVNRALFKMVSKMFFVAHTPTNDTVYFNLWLLHNVVVRWPSKTCSRLLQRWSLASAARNLPAVCPAVWQMSVPERASTDFNRTFLFHLHSKTTAKSNKLVVKNGAPLLQVFYYNCHSNTVSARIYFILYETLAITEKKSC